MTRSSAQLPLPPAPFLAGANLRAPLARCLSPSCAAAAFSHCFLFVLKATVLAGAASTGDAFYFKTREIERGASPLPATEKADMRAPSLPSKSRSSTASVWLGGKVFLAAAEWCWWTVTCEVVHVYLQIGESEVYHQQQPRLLPSIQYS